ncbi:MAG: hypothetical protein Q8O90_02300 [Elusimicrobiota bacterium]|nr:hypothetical protein [Elusimicrobiota bacterium]
MKTNLCAAFLWIVLSSAAPALMAQQEIIERITPPSSQDFTFTEKSDAYNDPKRFTLNKDSIRVTLLEVTEEYDMSYVNLTGENRRDLAGVLISIENIVNTASKVWQIIEKNQPVVNIDTKYATAYPQGITAASQLAQWSKPKTYSYGFYAENLYGAVMIDSKHNVIFSYNGAYRGKGKYLTGVTVVPTVANVSWGYKLYMSAAVPDSTIANVGTDADPVSSMQLKLTWRIPSSLKVIEGTSVYYIQGDGFFEEIASPWRKSSPKAEDVKAAAPLFDPEIFF